MLLSLALLALPLPAHAALNLKSGLWELHAKMSADGKVNDANARLEKMFAGMPPEKRKMMQEMMAKHGVGVGQNGAHRFCFSDAMIRQPESLAGSSEAAKDCSSKVVKSTGSSVELEFRCQSGRSGKASWTASNKESFTSVVEMKSKEGKTSRIEQTGKFVSANCGDVKPILGE